ncbi:MAG TPA: hypothetical protein VM680_15095 [Verrucomicrobiae bacterium]|nr:hypothetical protein [Verrucomicrobiae bacterium]
MKAACTILGALIAYVLLPHHSFAASVRLAIVTTSESIQPASDLLTASFSKQPNVELFERDKIQTILRERSLQTARLTQTIGVMRTAGADAVLFLEPSRVGTNNGIAIRLIATKPGAIVAASLVRWPVDEFDKWVQSIINQYGTPLNRVGVPDERLVKISLLNFRSPSSSSSAQLVDRELTTLIRLRLAREPELLVLERLDMLSLGVEKELAGSTEKFWTGSYLLDGAIDRDAATSNKVTLDLRVTAPGGKSDSLHIDGLRNDLSAVANSVATNLLQRVQRSASTPSWNPASEARAYREEAEWALRWEMWPEAIAAADAAWSLGAQDLESATTRLLAYARAGHQYNWRWSGITIDGQQFNWPVRPPDSRKLPTLKEGLNFINEVLARHPAAATNRAAYSAICEAIGLTGDLLLNYYSRAEARAGHEEELAEIRRVARQVSIALINNASIKPTQFYSRRPGMSDFDEIRDDIFVINATYAALFHETPEETAEAYRDLIENHYTQRYSEVFENREAAFVPIPVFGGWKWKDRTRGYDVLFKFAREMRGGPVDFTQFVHGSDMEAVLALTPEEGKAQKEKWAQHQARIREMMAPRTNRPVARAATKPPVARPAAPQLPPEPKALSSRPLTESEFWVLPLEKISEQMQHPNVSDGFMQWPIVRNGALWFRFYYTYYVRGPGIQPPSYGDCLVALNLQTLQPKFIPLDRPEFQRGFIWSQENRSFEVTSNVIYMVHNDRLLRRAIEKPSWTQIPTSVNSPQLFLIRGRLYLSGQESIQELTESGGFKTLASARRRPAQTDLDKVEKFDYPLLHGAREGLRVVLKDRQFLFDGAKWKEEVTVPVSSLRRAAASPGFLVYGKMNGAALFLSPPGTGPQFFARTFDYDGPTLPNGPQWLLSDEQVSYGQPLTIDDAPALLQFDKGTVAFAFKEDKLFDLLVFPPNGALPIHIPIALPKSKMTGFDQVAPTLINGEPFIVESPGHIFFSAPDFPGVWRIPKSQITARINEVIGEYNRTNQPAVK